MTRVIIAFMPRALKTLAVLLLVAVMPLRAMAAVTIGFCASGHQDTTAAAQAGHAHGAAAHQAHHGHDAPAQPVEPSCNVCAEHCSSAAFAPSADTAIESRPIGQNRTQLAARNAPAFVPDQLDRPPLA